MTRLLRALASVLVVGLWLWLIPCLWYLLPEDPPGVRLTGCLVLALLPPVALVALPDRSRTRRGLAIAIVLLFAAWLSIPASNDGDWATEYARLPKSEIDGHRVTLRDLRSFEWRSETDFTPRWRDARFDLRELETLDFIKVHWGSAAIAHTMLSFGFHRPDGGWSYLTVSAETRRRADQEWSSVAGFFKQYTLMYVLGDETDLLELRTNVRGEDLYLYPTTTAPEDIRFLLVDILESANDFTATPRWYNTITDNCTTSLARHIRKLRGRRSWDPRLLINGHTDEMGIESGWILPKGSLEETRAHYYANPRVEADPSDYSNRLRGRVPEGA